MPVGGSPGHPPTQERGVLAAAWKPAPSSASLSLASGLRGTSVVCAGGVATLSVVELLGWTLHTELLKRLLPGLPSMKANAAVCFLLASFSLIAYSRSAPRSWLRRAGAACATLVVLVGAATLVEYAFALRLGIDQLLFHDRVGPNAPYPGRPAANAALGFVFVGSALLCWEVRLRGSRASNLLAWPAAMLGFLALTGYATGAGSLIGLYAHQPIALSSAIALPVLSLGVLLARPDSGWLAGLAADAHTGVILRRLLPAAIALPAGLATLTLAGQRLGLFSTPVGVRLFVSAVTLAFMAVAWLTAAATQNADRTRHQAAQATARLAAIADSSDDAIIDEALDGRIMSWNPAAERIYGYSATEAIGQHISMLLAAGCDDELVGLLVSVAGGARVSHLEAVCGRKDGDLIDVSVTASPIRDAQDRVIGASTIARDITAHNRAERELAEHKRVAPELARLAEAAEHSADAVVSIDLEANVRHWNRGAERLYGWSAAEALGRSLYELTVFTDEPFDQVLRMLAGEPTYQYETARRRKDGTIIDVLLTTSPWHLDGEVVGVTAIAVAIDLSEHKRVEGACERALADLGEAQRFELDRRIVTGSELAIRPEHRISRTKARLTRVDRIEQALENNGFALVGQPILLHAGEAHRHELLLRMLQEHDDLIPPAAFLYIAERFGLIARLDQWVVTQANELIEQRSDYQIGTPIPILDRLDTNHPHSFPHCQTRTVLSSTGQPWFSAWPATSSTSTGPAPAPSSRRPRSTACEAICLATRAALNGS